MAMGVMGAHPYGFRRAFRSPSGVALSLATGSAATGRVAFRAGCSVEVFPEEGFDVWPLGFGAIMVLRAVH